MKNLYEGSNNHKIKIIISCLSKRLMDSINPNPVLGYVYSGVVNEIFDKSSLIIGNDKNFQSIKCWSIIDMDEIEGIDTIEKINKISL